MCLVLQPISGTRSHHQKIIFSYSFQKCCKPLKHSHRKDKKRYLFKLHCNWRPKHIEYLYCLLKITFIGYDTLKLAKGVFSEHNGY